ncbi:MAG: hypothetical protein IK102_09495 [Treponema sp.]|nr:hypothetical protein [Treponema sp.]
MKKSLSKLINVFFAAVFIFCCVSCPKATNENGNPENNNETQPEAPGKQPTDMELMVGSWFWDFGYDQSQFMADIITCKADGSFVITHKSPGNDEYDTGTYSIIDFLDYGKTLCINIKTYKDTILNENNDNMDLKVYFVIHSLDDEKLIMTRVRRDYSGMGGTIYDYEPGIYNEFYKIKDGNKTTLEGKWSVNKVGTPQCNWDETWTFTADGRLEDYYKDENSETTYAGTYEVITTSKGSVLHQVLIDEKNGNTYTPLSSPMEFWYDYKQCSDKIINVNCTRHIIDGTDETFDEPKVNYYYRDIELAEVTYHYINNSFKDYYPKGTEYTLIGLDKMYLFHGVPDYWKNQTILVGWYDNENWENGNIITKIPANDTGTHEYWAEYGIKLNKNLYDYPNNRYNFNATYHAQLFTGTAFTKPEFGDTIKVTFNGKASRPIDGEGGFSVVDWSNDQWKYIGQGWNGNLKTDENLRLSFSFDILIKNDCNKDDPNIGILTEITDTLWDIYFDIWFGSNAVQGDKPISFTDCSWTYKLDKAQQD